MMSVKLVKPSLRETDQAPKPLRHGERLTQPTFHRRYEAMPADVRAELVGGIVYLMSSPVGKAHSWLHGECSNWLMQFKVTSPALQMLDNATVILSSTGEPQPDLCLRILEEYGGSSRETETGYIAGPPELILEVSVSSAGYDLVKKKRDYERAGVREYVVVLPVERQVVWFALDNGRYEEIEPGEDGILRSKLFPGLWLNPEALLRADTRAVNAVVAQGIASPEHAGWKLERLVKEN